MLARSLSARVAATGGIKVRRGCYITEILRDNSGVAGVRGFDLSGDDVVIVSDAVVLAAGGAGSIYRMHDNQKGIMGQGYYLAARAGLHLWDMEFVQFYPFVLAEQGSPMVPIFVPNRAVGMRVVNGAGKEVLEPLGLDDLNEAISTKRDACSQALYRESRQGFVYMDFQGLPDSYWDAHPLGLVRRLPFDPHRRPVRISPAAHFCMGGVEIDGRGQTALPGLFACGEIVWGLHGANRVGGNALTECVVFGALAGRGAARLRGTRQGELPKPGGARQRPTGSPSRPRGRLRELRTEIRQIAWDHAGIVRCADGLQRGLDRLAPVDEELTDMVPLTVREEILVNDLRSAAFTARAVLTTSSQREESRGAFAREDFPERDDIRWHMNSCLTCAPDAGTMSVAFHEPPPWTAVTA
jgi:succinate dehydrogenase/fumarate reductase flavoprotein subunit